MYLYVNYTHLVDVLPKCLLNSNCVANIRAVGRTVLLIVTINDTRYEHDKCMDILYII